ncbi:FG-GAP repeat protein [Nocardioides sp.]|uniref:FG-GAP repeat protein n=1 Tax=Nocardioides sp. TaxID=35761 RepID=UPI001A214965|nr:FG-GAP repeat protein [Nocardioides sp.]MBJ7359115.1 FG-GAP repeat protein [Nocardioides sp.]
MPAAQALTREINPPDGVAAMHFGTSVAMDGDTLVVGAPGPGLTAPGAVYVFTRSAGETWTQAAKLTASDGSNGDGLGTAVSIDGDTIVAGAPGDDNGAGSVYLFARTGAAARTQVDRVTASDRLNGDALGSAVDIDGDTIVAGAPGDDNPGEDPSAGHGSVYTFATTGAPGRTQSAKLTASDNTVSGWSFAGSALGDSVAIDGDTIVAGAPSDLFGNPQGQRRGSVYTFARTGASSRQETAKLTVTGQTTGRVGESVDVEGDLIVAGDSQADQSFGAAWVFTRTGAAARNQTGKLTPSNPQQNNQFGASVSVSSSFIVVGATGHATRGTGFVFTRTGAAERTETWQTTGSAQFTSLYGASIVTDGDRVVGGAPNTDTSSPFLDEVGQVTSSTPTLFATSTGTGTGTITSSTGGITGCASACSEDFLLGDQTTLTATPSPGSHFAGWENHSECSGTGTCTVTMNGEPQVAARFTLGSPPGDTTPPVVGISSGPTDGSTITTSSATFGLTADETSTFQCAYDAEPFTPCTTPGPGTSGSDTRSGLAEGQHVFKVRATDSASNTSAALTRTFTVDLPTPPPLPPTPGDSTAPQTTITSAPPKKVFTAKKKAKVRLAFVASESATFLCKVDAKSYTSCRSPFQVRLTLGKHTILVVSVDAAGNRDATPARVVVKIKPKPA